jgi:hypothetical protein
LAAAILCACWRLAPALLGARYADLAASHDWTYTRCIHNVGTLHSNCQSTQEPWTRPHAAKQLLKRYNRNAPQGGFRSPVENDKRR